MKRKYLKFIAFVLILAGSFSACKDKEDSQSPLANTKWKLAGIGNRTEAALQELDPKDCEECYTLAFDTDNTITGQSSTNKLSGRYKIDNKTGAIFIQCGPNTYIAEIFDGYLYINILNKIESFSLQGNELILYYNTSENYMLFKSQ